MAKKSNLMAKNYIIFKTFSAKDGKKIRKIFNEDHWIHLCPIYLFSARLYSFIITGRIKKALTCRKRTFFENVVGTFCATCSATGYPCFLLIFFSLKLLIRPWRFRLMLYRLSCRKLCRLRGDNNLIIFLSGCMKILKTSSLAIFFGHYFSAQWVSN